jgi:hypothetical protein
MESSEPSVVLKLKKGGHVNKKAAAKSEHGHKPMHKYDGGAMDVLARTPAMVGRPAVNAPVRVPAKPSLAARRRAMAAMPAPVMKEGGKADIAQDKAMIKKAIKQHDAQEHKGGKGTKLNLKTGGVAMGNAGGYKKGGAVAKDGIIKSEKGVGPYNTTEMHEAKPDRNSAPTGGVKVGNAGGYKHGGKAQRKAKGGLSYVNGNVTTSHPGVTNTKTGEVTKSTKPGEYKKGGAAKKYADGGRVEDSGRAVKMPQGHKKPTPPVAINELSGTFKKGGHVKRKSEGGSADENKAYERWKANEAAENRADRSVMENLPSKLVELGSRAAKKIGDTFRNMGSVTNTEREVSRTVTPPQRKRGGMCWGGKAK